MIEISVQALCRNRELAVQYAVFVCFFTVTVAGMEIRLYFFGELNADIFRKSLVQCIGNLLPRDACVGVKYCHVSHSMNTCICTACTDGFYLLTESFGQCII